MTPFEQRLADTPHREIPAEWRARILAAASGAQKRPLPSILSPLSSLLSFPHPLAWGALAAAWVAIAVLNFSGPRGEALYAVTPKNYKGRLPAPGEYLVQMELRDRLIAQLDAETFEPQPAYYLRRQDL